MNIKLYNEDCIETMKRIPDESIDLMLTDIPYGTTACEWDLLPNLAEMWLEWERILKPNGVWLFTATMPMTIDIISPRKGFFKSHLVWDKVQKTGHLNAKKKPLLRHEDIIIMSRAKFGSITYNPQMRKGRYRDKSPKRSTDNVEGRAYGLVKNQKSNFNDDYYPSSIIEMSNASQNGFHPTQKPVDLFRYLIRTYSNEGETVYDGYSGSGTTAIACIKEKRNFIGAEMNKEYFDKSILRIEQAKSQLVLF